MYSNIVISVDELWLKGKNRKDYLRALVTHITHVFKAYHEGKFRYNIQSERFYFSSNTFFSEELITALTFVPGIAYISPCKVVRRLPDEKFDNVIEEVLKQIASLSVRPKTFRAIARRIDKTLSITSTEVGKMIGHAVLEKYPEFEVDLKKGELTVDVRVMAKNVSISMLTNKGVCGLPWGSTGHALTLLSGGFDSPVASFQMAKRGIKQSFVFFHAYPFVGREVLAKIKALASQLAKFQRQSHLYIVPFGDIQNIISKNCREEYRTLIFRKYMMDIANDICDRIGAEALITGDSVGQVSSQTMKNLHLMDLSSRRMIMRPLIGFNKLEILKCAEQIGTHSISLTPHDDACALFAPKHPIINPDYDYWKTWDKDLNMSSEFASALDKAEVYSINLKGELFKKDFFSFDKT